MTRLDATRVRAVMNKEMRDYRRKRAVRAAPESLSICIISPAEF